METKQVSFLKEKIESIGSAIFYNEGDGISSPSTSVIGKLMVDEFGFIWFYLRKKYDTLTYHETNFMVSMHVYRKGVDYHFKVDGKGWIVNDPEQTNHLDLSPLGEVDTNTHILMKVKILDYVYYEPVRSKKEEYLKHLTGSYVTLPALNFNFNFRFIPLGGFQRLFSLSQYFKTN